MAKITILEDDQMIAHQMANAFQKRGMQIKIIQNFTNPLLEIYDFKPDLILMDLYLPSHDGYYWTAKIREHAKLPIIFVSSAEEKLNTVAAINSGADDFITKPFDMEILITKVKSWLRRTYHFDIQHDQLRFKNYLLNLTLNTVTLENNQIKLTAHEAVILRDLFEHSNQIVSKQQLMTLLWDNANFVDENALQVTMNRLRKKLKPLKLDQFIQTKRFQGYGLING